MSLRLKANLLFLAGALALLLIGWSLIHSAVRRDAMASARQQAEALTQQVKVAGDYTSDKVTPLFSGSGRGQFAFVPASLPFYAIQTQARMLEKAAPGVSLRQVVLDPVNDDERPDAWEHEAIEKLRADPHPQPYAVERSTPHGDRLALVTPLSFSPGICATCYTSRSAAPPGIQDAYGNAPGFNRKPGEIVGAIVASVPLPRLQAGATAIGWLALSLLLLTGLFNLLLHKFFLAPLRRITAVAEKVSLGHAGTEEFPHAGDDEIGAVTRSFGRLRRSMETAIGLIES